MISLGVSNHFVDTVLTFLDFATPVFIPSVLVFAHHSSLSLRTWFAVQNAPTHVPAARLPQPLFLSSDEHQTRFTRLETKLLKFCHHYNILATIPPLWLAFTLFAGMLIQLTESNPLGVDAETFFRYALFPMFLISNCRLLASVMGVEKRLVFRSLRGRPFIQSYIRTDLEHALSFTPYLAAAFVSYRASFAGTDRLSLSVTYGALMHLLISSEITTTRSFKAAFLCAIVNAATMLLFFLSLASSSPPTRTKALLPFLDALIERTQLIFSQRHYGGLRLWSHAGIPDSETADNAKWPLFILSVLWSVFPADLISLCYRYDYHWHVTDTVLSSPSESQSEKQRLSAQDEDDIPDNASASFLNLSPTKAGRNAHSTPPALSSTSSTVTLTHQPPNVFYDFEDSYDFDFGARIPSSDSIPEFPMPFFCSSITTWVFCNLFLYTVLQLSGMTSSIEFHYVEALIALAAMPTMSLSILIVAISHHGVAPLWHYVEHWSRRN